MTKTQGSSLYLLLRLDATSPFQRYFGEDPLFCISTLSSRSEHPTRALGGHLTQRHSSESPAPTARGRERLESSCWPGAGLNYSLPTAGAGSAILTQSVGGLSQGVTQPGAAHPLLALPGSGGSGKLWNGGRFISPLPTFSRLMKPQTN